MSKDQAERPTDRASDLGQSFEIELLKKMEDEDTLDLQENIPKNIALMVALGSVIGFCMWLTMVYYS